MGGMSAFIPVKNDLAANVQALDKVRADKLREAGNGHDGTWVAHPALVPVALEAFAAMEGPNQLYKKPLQCPARGNARASHRTPHPGARANIRVAVQYIAAWLAGRGAVPLYNLMEDAATAEICRAQLAVAEVRGPVRRRPPLQPIFSRIGWPTSSPRSATYPTSSPPPACSTSWSRPTSSRSSDPASLRIIG